MTDAITVAHTRCADEPIHLLGAVQAYGMLLAVDPASDLVVYVSDNVEAFLGSPADVVLGAPFSSLFVPACGGVTVEEGPGTCMVRCVMSSDKTFIGNHHRNPQRLVVWEFEPPPSPDNATDWFTQSAQLQHTVSLLHSSDGRGPLLDLLCREVQRLTGFDRVMVYRFDTEWHGEVVAEARQRGDSYMGQRFPASDIPPQARAVFLSNWVRSIADVHAPASHVITYTAGGYVAPLDLSCVYLRQPSATHLEYLRNMGVGATMTLSLLHQGGLWGLVACHHLGKRRIAAHAVESCKILAQLASSLLGVKQDLAVAGEHRRLVQVQYDLVARVRGCDDTAVGLTRLTPNVLDVVAAGGAVAAIYADRRWAVIGKVPSLEQIRQLVAWLDTVCLGHEYYTTDRLSRVYPPADTYKDLASGLLAISIPNARSAYVLWFRPEVSRTVQWAGNPHKPVAQPLEGEVMIHPRTSFRLWQEHVTGHATPFSPIEIEAALLLRKGIIETDFERQLAREQQARAETEVERRRFSFLSEASAKLSTTLDGDAILETLGRLSVQGAAEWAVVRIVHGDIAGQPRLYHRHAVGARVLAQVFEGPGAPVSGGVLAERLAAGKEIFEARTTPALLTGAGAGRTRALFAELVGLRSYLAVPMCSRRGEVIGSLEWAISDAPRVFAQKDLELAKQLTLRAANAYENATLFAETQAAVKAREELVSVVSHDLKNPLTAMGLNAQAVLRAIAKNSLERASSAAQKIVKAGERMRRLIDDLLSMSRLDGGKVTLNKQPMSLTALLQESAEFLAPIAASKGVELEVEPVMRDGVILGEWDRLLQVLSNVGGNAIKFSPPGTKVAMRLNVTHNKAIVSVCDQGVGIPKEHLGNIFRRFWQATATASQGTGLGLPIAKGFVEAHSGQIWAESEVGKFTTIHMAFPTVVDQPRGTRHRS